MRKKVFLSLLFVFGLFSYIFSQETANLGELQGEVVWRGKDKIGIIFKKGPEGEEEILLPIDNQTTFEHIKKFEDLERGDIVYVQIEEVMSPSADGTLVPSKKIKKLSLIKKGKKKEIPAVTQEQIFKQEDILKSQ